MNNFDTVREALELATPHYQADTARFAAALTALTAIKSDHFTPGDMADAQAKAFRAGVASVQQGEPVHQFRNPHCSDWYDGVPDHHDGHGPYEVRTLYTAAPVAQQSRQHPKLTPERLAIDEEMSVLGARAWRDLQQAVEAQKPANAVRNESCVSGVRVEQPQADPFGTFVERSDGTTEFRRQGEAHTPTALGFKVTRLFSGQQPQAEAVPSESAVVAGARVLNQRAAESCGVNADDQWFIYGEDFKDDVRAILSAAQGAKT